MEFTIYSNNTIRVEGAKPKLRIKALTKNGHEQNLTSGMQQRVRVYDCSDVRSTSQPFVDFDMPAYIGGPADWKTNPELARAIAAAFPA